MAKILKAILCAFAVGLVLSTAVAATEKPYGDLVPFKLVEEARGGLFGDDAVHREGRAPMISAQILSSPLPVYATANPWLATLLNPRLEAGGMVNGRGLTSYAFTGFNWRTPQWGPLFGEIGLGGALNDSSRDPHRFGRTDLGCPVTFRESAGVGFRLSEHLDIVGSIEHISHANLCNSLNPGLTSVGVRLGYLF